MASSHPGRSWSQCPRYSLRSSPPSHASSISISTSAQHRHPHLPSIGTHICPKSTSISAQTSAAEPRIDRLVPSGITHPRPPTHLPACMSVCTHACTSFCEQVWGDIHETLQSLALHVVVYEGLPKTEKAPGTALARGLRLPEIIELNLSPSDLVPDYHLAKATNPS